MNLLSKADFGRAHGLLRQSVGQAIKRGTLKANKAGDVVLDDPLTLIFLAKHAKRRLTKATERVTGKAPPPVAGTPVPQMSGVTPEMVKAVLVDDDEGEYPDEITAENFKHLKKAQIEKWKSFETAKKVQQEREAKRGDLIRRDLVEAVFAKLYTVDTDELKALEEKLIPLICGVAGISDDDARVSKIQKGVNKEVSRALKHIKRIMESFLKKHPEADAI